MCPKSASILFAGKFLVVCLYAYFSPSLISQDFRSDAAYEYEPIVDIADLDSRPVKRASSPVKARRHATADVSEMRTKGIL